MDFQQWKTEMIDVTGLAKDALHIHIGLLVFILVRLVWRGRGGWIVAWLVALAFALGGEWLDIRAEEAASALQPDPAHWHDVWNTMLWPTIFLVVGRWLQPQAKPPKPVALPLTESDSNKEEAQAG
jgi:hypothetical protein